MATIFVNTDAEALVDGAVTNGVVGGWDNTLNPSTTSLYADATSAMHGTMGFRCHPTGGSYANYVWTTAITGRPLGNIAVRGYVRFKSNVNTANQYFILAKTSAGAMEWRVDFSAAGKVSLLNSGGIVWTDGGAFARAVNVWYRVEVWMVSASTGRLQVFQGDGTVPVADSGSITWTATVATNSIEVGIAPSGTGITDLDLDDWAVGTGGLLGRPAGLPSVAPTVAPMTSLDKAVGDPFTFTAVPSLGDGTSITAHEWTITEQAPGTGITLTGAATATVSGACSKAGALVLQYRAKDNNNQWSLPAAVTAFVAAGDLTPLRPRALLGSTTWTSIGSGDVGDASDASGVRSPDDPVSQSIAWVMQPAGMGGLAFTVRGLKVTAGASNISRVVECFTDASMGTRVYSTTQLPDTAVSEKTVTVDSAGLALVPSVSSRRAMVVKLTSTKV